MSGREHHPRPYAIQAAPNGVPPKYLPLRSPWGRETVYPHRGDASSVQQALRAGLLDEFHMNIAHVLLGEGVRLFDHLGSEPIQLERTRTLETPGATHLSFRVVK